MPWRPLGGGRRLGELMATGHPAAGEVRRPSGIDAVQRESQTRLEPRRGRRQRLHGVDLIVVDDQRRAVGVPQPRDGQIDPLLGQVEFAALHRPGAVEDERDVEGRRPTRSRLVVGRGETRTSSVASPPLAAISGFSHCASMRGVLLAARGLRRDGFAAVGRGVESFVMIGLLCCFTIGCSQDRSAPDCEETIDLPAGATVASTDAGLESSGMRDGNLVRGYAG